MIYVVFITTGCSKVGQVWIFHAWPMLPIHA